MLLFRVLYYLVLTIIFVGEFTRKLFYWLWQGAKTIYFFVFSTIKKIIKLILKFLSISKKIILKIKRRLLVKPFFLRVSLKTKYFLYGVLLSLFIFNFYQGYKFLKSLPSPYNIGKINFPLSTHIYDRKGRLLYEIYREQNRTPVKLIDLPAYVAQATIAIEDKNFYNHRGVSILGGIVRALREIIFKKKIQGGSTITQQLVKTSLLTSERTITRKIKEIILALWAERIYSKDEILEMYLNQVPYGGAAYGIEEAAKRYFGKSAKKLNLEEAATLAGLPQAPTLYSPYTNPQLTLKRRNEVLEAMYHQGYIDEKTKTKAQKSKLNFNLPSTNIEAPHFVFYIKNHLEKLYGIETVEEGGLRILTSLDLDIQKEVEKILKEEIEKIRYLNVTNGAVLVVRPKTGEILSLAGSVDYFATPSGAFNVVTALRQPGSAIKPVMYSLALQKGYTAASIIDDLPVSYILPNGEIYRPVNYDGRFHGKIPLRYALANSYNVPAVKVLSTIGVKSLVEWGRKMGIVSWKDPSNYGLSLTLGGGEVTMIELAQSYSVFANMGNFVPINGVLEVKDYFEKIDYHPYQKLYGKILDEGIVYIINDILSDNFARQWAFGSRSLLEIPGYRVAVKTGTTDNKKDNWTIGYTPEFLVAVWVGNNDGSPMNPYLTSGITGAASIWNRIMTFLLKNYGSGVWFQKPDSVVEKKCYFGRIEYFVQATENTTNCNINPFSTPTPTKSYQ